MMPSVYFYLFATFLLSLNFVRPWGLAISDWLYFASMGLAFIETLIYENKNFHCWTKNLLIWPAVLILFGAILSTIRSNNVRVAIIEIFQQIYVITVFISLTWIMVRRGYGNWIARVFIFSGLVTATVALLDYLTGSHFGPMLSGTPNADFYYRYAGTLGHPNKLGYFLVLTGLLTLAQWGIAHKAHIKQTAWAIILAVQIGGIFISGSVTAYLGILLGCIALLLRLRQLQKKILFLTISVIPIASLFLIFLFMSGNITFSQSERENNIIWRSLNRVGDITAQTRVVVYEQALQKISESPIIGVGYDQVSTSNIESENRFLETSVHNALLQILYTGGLFAFAGWAFIYLYLGWQALKTILAKNIPNHNVFMAISLASGVLSILLMDQFQDAIYQREKWLIFGLFFSYISSTKILHANLGEKHGSVTQT